MMLLVEDPLEPVLTTNEFNNPTVLKGQDAVSQLLIHLILLEPGTYACRPNMGVGLVSRYRHNDEASLEQLTKDIHEQIQMFLPEFEDVDVGVELDDSGELILNIRVDDTLYKYETSKQDDNDIRLLDLSA